ncbi:DinB family protein [Hyunsoonleella sp. SJ7]|uniref:DinB family protein n=1 Tax=Hyunsoonleella aquatilis TaxID=2762758 RepID=A0A923KN30_9FLAO|nr:DinB family protein [Hyunsoonleella aquatilis]MBC3759695.1 DinB family protein [Hyunsoonleella aquatilis]
METTPENLKRLISAGHGYLKNASESDLKRKPSPSKWSKKEILGHLIDSAINNLQRFTEIQFENKPYIYRPYSQLGLINANNYQNSDTKELIDLWLALNKRILFIIGQQTETTLNFMVQLNEGHVSDLRFLINDYVIHLEHHVNQIVK